MKSIAHRLLVVAAMVFVVGLLQVVNAQGQGMRMSPKERAEALGKQLSLDSVTVAKVVKIMEKSQKTMMDKRAELQGGDMDAMRSAMMEIRDSTNKEITALLTKEQAKKYEEILKEQQQRMQQRQRNN